MSEAPPLFPAERRAPKNPFRHRGGDRESFPNIDFAFGTPGDKNVDQSVCSYDGSSVLNISIGARAALNDHNRHVAKFGIDGEQVVDDYNHEQTPKNDLDEQWDHLLDDNSSRVNTSGSFAAVPSYPPLDLLCRETSGVESSIEVLTDVSHDYFNSSRVKMLATPERNRNRLNHVITREEVAEQQPFEESYDQFYETDTSAHNLAPELKVSQGSISDRNSSFQSFCVADISRISNVDSETRRSPENSFQDHHPTTDDAAFSPILDDVSPSQCHDSSFASSTPRRAPPKQDVTPKLPVAFGSSCEKTALRPHRLSQEEKENGYRGYNSSPICSDNSNSFTGSLRAAQETISQAAAAACSRFGISEIPAIDSMPADFLRALESAISEAPSPISQIDSHIGNEEASSQESSSRRRRLEKSSSSSSVPSLTGRKRYRTVVPRRIYMDSSPSKFPEENDSFSTPHSSAEESPDLAQRSLLNSFETAYH